MAPFVVRISLVTCLTWFWRASIGL